MAKVLVQPSPSPVDSLFVSPVRDDGAVADAAVGVLPTLGAARQARSARDQELLTQIELLDLLPIQRAYLRQRWLSEMEYLATRARQFQRQHSILQVLIIVGGVTVPALVGLQIGNEEDKWWGRVSPQQVAFVLGLVVAIGAALEGFFRWGERWRHFRQRREQLTAEGWAFLELAGPYRRFDTHQEAFRAFVTRAEDLIRKEVEVYITEVMRNPEAEGASVKKAAPPSGPPSIQGPISASEALHDTEDPNSAGR